MPPFKADNSFQHYKNENYLSPDEINIIQDWITGGAKKGKNLKKLKSADIDVDIHSNQLHKTLSTLLKDSPYRIHYNDHQMQALKNGISTCGKHCVVRCFNSDKNIDEYFRAVKYNSKKDKISMDELIYRLYKF